MRMTSLKYGLFFVLPGAAAAWLALGLDGSGRVVAGWFSAALLAVGVAYWVVGPRLFLKRPGGTMHPAAWVGLWPFHLLNGLLFHGYHGLCRRPPYHQILTGLYLGRRLYAREARALGVGAVLDLTCELPENRVMRAGGRYLCLPVLDNTEPTPEQLRRAVDWLAENLAAGSVYVHCAAGYGRSATVLVAYLLSTGVVGSVDEGIAYLRAKRPGVRLNRSQRRVLEPFEEAAGGARVAT